MLVIAQVTLDMLQAADKNRLSAAFPELKLDRQFRYNIAYEDENPVGIVKLHHGESNIHIEWFNVAEGHRHLGVAKHLLESVFATACKEGKIVTNDGFTSDGQAYLRPMMERLSKSMGVASETIGRC